MFFPMSSLRLTPNGGSVVLSFVSVIHLSLSCLLWTLAMGASLFSLSPVARGRPGRRCWGKSSSKLSPFRLAACLAYLHAACFLDATLDLNPPQTAHPRSRMTLAKKCHSGHACLTFWPSMAFEWGVGNLPGKSLMPVWDWSLAWWVKVVTFWNVQ